MKHVNMVIEYRGGFDDQGSGAESIVSVKEFDLILIFMFSFATFLHRPKELLMA